MANAASVHEAFQNHQAAIDGALAEFGGKLAEIQDQTDRLEEVLNRPDLSGGSSGDRQALAAQKDLGTFLKTGIAQARSNGMHTLDDPEGGYSVDSKLERTIIQAIHDISPIRQIARVKQIEVAAYEEINDPEEAEAHWIGETSARDDTDAGKIGKLTIPTFELYSQPKATQTLIEDSAINIATWLFGKIANRFARKEGRAFVLGTGVGEPQGFLSTPKSDAADDARPWGTIQFVNSGAAAAITADGLIDLQAELKVDYLPGAVWVMNRRTLAAVRKLKDGEGNYLLQRSLIAGTPDMLLGHPVKLAEDMPGIEENSFPVAFGHFGEGYTVVDRVGVSVLRDPYSSKPFVKFYTRKRVGGGVANFEAIKLLKISA